MVVITRESLTQRNKFVLTRESRPEVLVVLGQVLLDDPRDEAGVEAGEDWLVDPSHVTLRGQRNPLTMILTIGEADVLVVVKLPGQVLYVGQDSTGVGLLLCQLLPQGAVNTVEYVAASPRRTCGVQILLYLLRSGLVREYLW